MVFASSRNPESTVGFSQALINGIAPDGGLYVPTELPKLSVGELIRSNDYRTMSHAILSHFTDFPTQELCSCIESAYNTRNFATEKIVPVVEVGEVFVLELFHGRSFAFKDLALSFLPHAMRVALSKLGLSAEIVILTATSGDTGKAALEAFANVEGTRIIVFYPVDGVSRIQKLQMVTQEGTNVSVVGIQGNFDDAQSAVKQVFVDPDFTSVLRSKNIFLSSANSINIGRLVPQIVYYFHGYAELVRSGFLDVGAPVNVVVPTGNFGNILAAYYAKLMGLPVRKLICASNKNKVLTDFFRTGTYDLRRPFYVTNSPSMDILVSSNLERYIYEVSGRDHRFVLHCVEGLKHQRFFTVPSWIHERMKDEFYANYADEDETLETIADVYRKFGYLIDPHTAVAFRVFDRYVEETGDKTPTLLAATASPFKFPEAISEAFNLGGGHDPFEALELLRKKLGLEIPEALANLRYKPVRHDLVCDKEGVRRTVGKLLNID